MVIVVGSVIVKEYKICYGLFVCVFKYFFECEFDFFCIDDDVILLFLRVIVVDDDKVVVL